MKKILSVLAIVFLFASLLVPIVSASYVCPAALTGSYGYTSGYYLSALHPSTGTAKSIIGDAFTANATSYLYNVTIYMYKVGSPTASITARLYAATGTVGTNAYPTSTALASSSPIWSEDIIGSWSQFTFIFAGNYEMQASTDYVILFEVTSSGMNAANYVYVATHAVDASNNGVRYAVGTWLTSTDNDLWYIINGDTTVYAGSTPTPTPTPEPTTPGTGDADIEALTDIILPWLVPLLICLIPALLAYKFVGELGFFIGLNVGCILAYVTLASTAYAFPLWGIILVGVMDVAVVLMRR